MSCMCGATDCPSCGRDQGYVVAYDPVRGHFNPETDEEIAAYEESTYPDDYQDDRR